MILVTNARIHSITKSVRIRTIITKTTILLENYGIFRATDSRFFAHLCGLRNALPKLHGSIFVLKYYSKSNMRRSL